MGQPAPVGRASLAFVLAAVWSIAGPAVPVKAERVQGWVTVAGARDNRDAVVYIDRIPGRRFTPPKEPVVVDQLNLRFDPHVRPILVGTTVAFPNSDEVRHNVFSPSKTSRFDLGTYPMGMVRSRVFSVPGIVMLLCNVHAEMSAYLVVTETPYASVTDRNGHFTLADVPIGEFVLRVWHERAKPTAVDIRVVPDEGASVRVRVSQ